MNLLKPYHACGSGASATGAQSPPEPGHPVCSLQRVSMVAAELEDGLPCLDSAVLHDLLKNLESLCNFHVLLDYLSESKQADLSELLPHVSLEPLPCRRTLLT